MPFNPKFGLGGCLNGAEVNVYPVNGSLLGSVTRSLSDQFLPPIPDVVIVDADSQVITSGLSAAVRLPTPAASQLRSVTMRVYDEFGALLFSKTVQSKRAFRLPPDLRRQTALSFEFVGNADLRQFDAAESMAGLDRSG